MAGKYFEEFEVGQRFEHAVRRTVTETDNLLFSALTMNPAAIHLDAEYSRGTAFGQRQQDLALGGGAGQLAAALSAHVQTVGDRFGQLGIEQ